MRISKHFVPNLGTILIVSLFLLVQSAAGSPPVPAALSQMPSATLISYQGRLADAGGNPLTGDYQMQFALYGVPTGGSACWSETQTISVFDGLFNVLLGSVAAIDPACLTGDIYLGITVGSDSEMTPRELLTSAPHAVQASTVPDSSITAEKLNLVDGNVGIGTTSPEGKLHVVGGNVPLLVKGTWSVPANAVGMRLWNVNNEAVFDVWQDGRVNTQGGATLGGGLTVGGLIQSTNTWDGAMYFKGGDDAALYDVNVANTMGIYGEQDSTQGHIKLGSNGPTISGVNGNIGIGATTPGKKLQVNDGDGYMTYGDTSGVQVYNAEGSSGETRLGAAWNRPGVYSSTTLNLLGASGLALSGRGNATDLYVNTSGNIGIGTTDPSEKLQVNGNLNMTNQQIKNVNRISSSGDLTIDAGDGSRRTLTLQDDVRIPDGALKFKDNPGGGGGDYAQIRYYAETGENTRLEVKVQNDGDDDIYLSASGPIYIDGSDAIVKSNLVVEGTDITLKGRNSGASGNPGRALVDGGSGAGLMINFDNDFGGWQIAGPANSNLDMGGKSILNCGALVEANLQTSEELVAGEIDRFEEGDLLCWGIDQLEKCASAGDPLVQAVADKNGRPIVIGAEVIKVLGPVKRGDLLVASSVPGYASVNNDPAAGAVIAQALEDFAGEKGLIKAMIRKF